MSGRSNSFEGKKAPSVRAWKIPVPIVLGIFSLIFGQPRVLLHFRRAYEIKTCHIIFISRSETRHMDEIVSSLKGKPIFTVAAADGPSSAGAIIRFIVENNKVHFRVNQEAAEAAGLTSSSKLLRLADAAPPERAP